MLGPFIALVCPSSLLWGLVPEQKPVSLAQIWITIQLQVQGAPQSQSTGLFTISGDQNFDRPEGLDLLLESATRIVRYDT